VDFSYITWDNCAPSACGELSNRILHQRYQWILQSYRITAYSVTFKGLAPKLPGPSKDILTILTKDTDSSLWWNAASEVWNLFLRAGHMKGQELTIEIVNREKMSQDSVYGPWTDPNLVQVQQETDGKIRKAVLEHLGGVVLSVNYVTLTALKDLTRARSTVWDEDRKLNLKPTVRIGVLSGSVKNWYLLRILLERPRLLSS